MISYNIETSQQLFRWHIWNDIIKTGDNLFAKQHFSPVSILLKIFFYFHYFRKFSYDIFQRDKLKLRALIDQMMLKKIGNHLGFKGKRRILTSRLKSKICGSKILFYCWNFFHDILFSIFFFKLCQRMAIA